VALITVDGFGYDRELWIDDRARRFGIEVFALAHRTLDVREQHRNRFALALGEALGSGTGHGSSSDSMNLGLKRD
jgi:hypothetical protein